MAFDYTSLTSAMFKLPPGWKVDKIRNVAKINEACIQKNYKYKWIKYIDISSVDKGEIRSIIELEISNAPSRAKRIVKDNDSLISTVRPNLEHYAFIKKAEKNYIASTGFAVITAKTIDPQYLYYYITSKPFTNYLSRIADSHTSAYPAFNPDVLEDAELIIPTPQEQKAIAHILGTLDDMIELNRQMNETLEAMARALFKSWFVDFDPVRAKAEGRDPVLPPDIANLFPDSFEESELGLIPKGWDVVLFPKAFTLSPLRSLKKGTIAPYLDMKNMPTHLARPQIWINREYTAGSKFINGDTLVARITPCLENGKTAFVDFLDNNQIGWGSTEYIVIRNNPPLTPEYGYFFARTIAFRTHAITNMTGSSGRQRVQISCFNNFNVIVPPRALAEYFGNLAAHLISLMKINDEETVSLSKIRDELLPKLISGEIRVPDAEKFIKENLE